MPLVVAIVLAILAAAASGLLIDLLLYQQLERRGAFRTSLFIASLGLLILIENVLVDRVHARIRCAWTSAC